MTKMLPKDIPGSIRVAVVFERGKLLPRWFEFLNGSADRIMIKSINQVWKHMAGSAEQIHHAVTDTSGTTYVLTLNTRDMIWSVKVVEATPDF